ncbi:MAG: sugar transferase, partial [Acidimicrobiales bacterium]
SAGDGPGAGVEGSATRLDEPVEGTRATSLVAAETSGVAASSWLRIRLFAFDLLSVLVAWFVVCLPLDHGYGILGELSRSSLAAGTTLIAMRALGLYRSRVCAKWSREAVRLVGASLVGGLAFVAFEQSLHGRGPEVGLISGAVCLASATLFRGHYRRWLSVRRAHGQFLRNVVLIGSNDDSMILWTMLTSEPELGYRIAAVIGDAQEPRPWDGLPRSATPTDLPQLAAATQASGVLIVANAVSSKELAWIIALSTAYGLHIQIWSGLYGVGSPRLREVPISGEPFYYVEQHRTYQWQLWAKRTIDVVASGLVLLLAIPALVLAAAAIKLERGGPVLHRQRRVGLNGDLFTIYKLRTMFVGSEQTVDELQALNQRKDGPLYKSASDPRVTKVGRLLRPLSLDELPQLWNVFRGSMSLVGPRPALPHEVAQFDEELHRRHTMRPGITGLWQARARENPSFNAYRRLDLHYVDNWSLRLDLMILLVTVPTVLSQAIQGVRRSRARRHGTHPSLQRQ